jgi:hypothetical protein
MKTKAMQPIETFTLPLRAAGALALLIAPSSGATQDKPSTFDAYSDASTIRRFVEPVAESAERGFTVLGPFMLGVVVVQASLSKSPWPLPTATIRWRDQPRDRWRYRVAMRRTIQ